MSGRWGRFALDGDWEESKHPRGQPGNSGQFSSSGGGLKKKKSRENTPAPKNFQQKLDAISSDPDTIKHAEDIMGAIVSFIGSGSRGIAKTERLSEKERSLLNEKYGSIHKAWEHARSELPLDPDLRRSWFHVNFDVSRVGEYWGWHDDEHQGCQGNERSTCRLVL